MESGGEENAETVDTEKPWLFFLGSLTFSAASLPSTVSCYSHNPGSNLELLRLKQKSFIHLLELSSPTTKGLLGTAPRPMVSGETLCSLWQPIPAGVRKAACCFTTGWWALHSIARSKASCIPEATPRTPAYFQPLCKKRIRVPLEASD